MTFDLRNGAYAMSQVNILKGRVENNALNITIGGDTLIVSNTIKGGVTLIVSKHNHRGRHSHCK